jgi:hypothetical protein
VGAETELKKCNLIPWFIVWKTHYHASRGNNFCYVPIYEDWKLRTDIPER